MADKSKMSVAEMLAAARKADGGGDEAAPPAESASAEEAAPAEAAATEAPAKIPAKGAGRPSVADMLAMARGDKGAPTAKAAPAKATPKPAVKPAAKKAKPAAKKSEPVDTQSILAAARKSKAERPGPMTKAEAAAKGSPVAKPKKPKEEIYVPPMPKKPDYAKPAADKKKDEVAQRRVFLLGMSALTVGFAALSATSFFWVMEVVRFMFPNVLREPPSQFTVGFPDAFPAEVVETKYKAQYGVWVTNTNYNGEQQIYALKSVCTHLGCTPNWLEGEQKFKCPCHGSGFYKDGINFEGPAPRPLERYAISIADDGQIQIDKSRVFQEEMGQWSDPASYLPV